MGNLVSQDLEGSYNRLCTELMENDPKHEEGCLHWATPTFKTEQLTFFIECLGKNTCLKRLVLRDLDGLNDTPSLAKAIQQHSALVCLGFNGRLPKQNFQVFVDAFFQSETITELEIQNSIIPVDTIDGMIAVLKQQQQTDKSKITSLALKGCQVEASLLDRLTEALTSSPTTATTLQKLEITLKPPIQSEQTTKNLKTFFQAKDSALTEVKFAGFLQNALPSLLDGAKRHPQLKRITLEGKGVNDKDSTQALAQLLLEAPPLLEVLNLSQCNLASDCGVQLAKALQQEQDSTNKSAGLKELLLSHNSLACPGVQALSAALEQPTCKCRETLQVLDLRMNRIGIDGMVALCKALATNPPALKRLYIGEEAIRPNPRREFEARDVQALADMLEKNSVLGELHLEDASFDDEASLMESLMEAIGKNKTLQGLFLSVYTTTGVQTIATVIPKLTHLEKLHVKVLGTEASLDEATGETLLAGLEKNQSLHQFVLSDLKGPSAAIWKALEPKIQAVLSERGSGPGAKRSLNGGDDNAETDPKRSKTE